MDTHFHQYIQIFTHAHRLISAFPVIKTLCTDNLCTDLLLPLLLTNAALTAKFKQKLILKNIIELIVIFLVICF